MTKKKKKNNTFFKVVSYLLLFTAILSTIFLIYFEVLPVNYLSIIIIGGGLLIFLLFKLLNNKRLKKWIKIIVSVPSMILIILFTLVCFYSYGTIDFFNNIFDSGIRHDSYSVYVLKDSKSNLCSSK